MKKRFFTLLLVLCMILTSCLTMTFSAYAQSSMTLQQLQAKFPQDKYWNHQAKTGHGYNGFTHYGSACGDVENTWTEYPCTNHSGIAPVGGYDCNCYASSLQCCGFAKKLANLAYGQLCTSWSCTTNLSTAISIVKPGDVIHYYGCYAASDTGHWVFVTAVSGSVITVGECNGPKTDSINDGGDHGCIYTQTQYCRINWTRKINMNRMTSIYLYSAPSALSTEPATVNVSFSEMSTSNISETNAFVKFNASISGGVSYQIGLEVEGVKTYIYPQTFTMTNIPNTYDLTAECEIVLQPGTNYRWRALVITANKTYYSDYLSFKTKGEQTYTVSYNANGGDGVPEPQTKIHGKTLTLSSATPKRKGYSFLGWSPKSESTTAKYQPGGSYTANESVTLYAIWQINTYTVSYNANGGVGAPAPQTKAYGVDLTLSTAEPTRDGYAFYGWAKDKTATEPDYLSGETYSDNLNITLYAIWVKPQITLAESSIKLAVGDTFVLGKTVEPDLFPKGKSAVYSIYADVDDYIIWSSSDEAVASVTNKKTITQTPGGKISALSPGTTKITAKLEYKGTVCYATCNVEVTSGLVASGSCGKSAKWEYYKTQNKNELIITGNGPMTDFASLSKVPWRDYRTEITTVTVSNGITTIGDYAFYGFENWVNFKMVSISGRVPTPEISTYLSGNIKRIGNHAFENCTKLQYLKIPFGVTEIGECAFCNCKNLNNISNFNIPIGVKELGDSVFSGCTALNKVQIPDSVTTIDKYAFSGCENLKIKCYNGSEAFDFALCNGISYELLDIVYGDISGEGRTDAEDLSYCRKALLTFDSETYSALLDVNGDGVVDIRDLVRLKKYLANGTPLGKQESNNKAEQPVTEIANITNKKEYAQS